jgi:hemolysin III
MALFSASTLYHSAKKPKWRYFCKLLDHCSIYLLIAGTYTPLVLLKFRLHDATQSWLLFTIIWLVAAVGIFYELYFHGKNKLISLGLYLIAGWTGIFFYRPLMMTLSPDAMLWLVAGGAFYTLGAVFYAVKKIPYNHALWHFFVLGGAFCHYVMTYQFIFPRS